MSSPCSGHHSPTFYHLLLLLVHCSPPCRPRRLGRFCSRCFGGLLGCRWLGHSLWSLLLHPILFHQVIHCSSKVHLLSHINWIWKKIALFTQEVHEKTATKRVKTKWVSYVPASVRVISITTCPSSFLSLSDSIFLVKLFPLLLTSGSGGALPVKKMKYVIDPLGCRSAQQCNCQFRDPLESNSSF